MVGRDLPPGFMKAGEEYDTAMRHLGLTPDFLAWGWDAEVSSWVLVMVTSIVDAGGPLELNKLLFDAYNARATPRAISPFIVRVFSPEIVPPDFGQFEERERVLNTTLAKAGKNAENTEKFHQLHGIEIQAIHCYERSSIRRQKYQDRRRAWDKFKRNVERLAA